MLRCVVCNYRRLRTTCLLRLQGSGSPRTMPVTQVRNYIRNVIGCPETSLTTYLRCVTSQKVEGLIYTAEVARNHASICLALFFNDEIAVLSVSVLAVLSAYVLAVLSVSVLAVLSAHVLAVLSVSVLAVLSASVLDVLSVSVLAYYLRLY